MQILGLLGMYFDAVVVEVKTFSLLFRLALAMLCSFPHCVRVHKIQSNFEQQTNQKAVFSHFF